MGDLSDGMMIGTTAIAGWSYRLLFSCLFCTYTAGKSVELTRRKLMRNGGFGQRAHSTRKSRGEWLE